MKDYIRISIIIPCFNDGKYIREAVISAVNQTYPNKEIIVIDDGSDNQTKLHLEQIKYQISKLITQPNLGVSAARNNGIEACSGDIIVTLDSDDYFEPTFLEKGLEILVTQKNVKIVTCNTRRFSARGTIDIFKPRPGDLEDILINNCAMGSSMFWKRDWLKVGGYDRNLRAGFEDWEFYIRLLEGKGCTFTIPQTLLNYRLREDSRSKKANVFKYELLKYIYVKHQDLYQKNYEKFIDHLLSRLQREELEKIKNLQRLDFRIGNLFLSPLRFIKSLF